MELTAGRTLSHYRLIEKIGEGGMGVVWKALDTTLDREVAIKVLPEALAADAERLARFEREAKVLASLNHPNIAGVYGLHEADGGVRFIAMELVAGNDLAARLERGPLPVTEALRLCSQVAEALEAAHDRGIIHRDLKPANILVTPDGRAKVLDFGLAKALTEEPDGTSDPSLSPTMTSLGTQAGVLLGTAAYMSPEQARGGVVDVRSDVWAFGCVLFEALTAKRAFAGSTMSDSLAAVLAKDPPWEALPAATPPRIHALLRRFLDKDVTRRPRDVGFARVEIGDVLDGDPHQEATEAVASEGRAAGSGAAIWIAAILLGAVGFAVGWFLRPQSPPEVGRDLHASLPFPEGVGRLEELAISPDGNTIVVGAIHDDAVRLFTRQLDRDVYRDLPETDGASSPFFSPDGKWIGFFADGKMKKIAVDGGTPIVLCDASDARGGVWGADGTIYFTPSYTGGLWRVQAAGGTPVQLSHPDPERDELSHRWPDLLPGGRALLMTIELPGSFDNAQIGLFDLETNSYRVLIEDGTQARYAASGHIVFARQRTLYALPFDTERLEPSGTAAAVVDGVAEIVGSGRSQFAFSRDGLLVYGSSEALENSRVIRVGRDGVRAPFIDSRGSFDDLRVSPDGRKLAMSVSQRDIWVYDLERGSMTRLTLDPSSDWFASWFADSQRIVFSSTRDGAYNLYSRNIDGSGQAERLTTSDHDHTPSNTTPDGKTMLFAETHADTATDLWLLHLDDELRVEPFLVTEHDTKFASFSPDGRWVAYTSNESGTQQVHVRPYPGPGGRWQVSIDGGTHATWSRDGRELFYLAPDGIWSVSVADGPDFRAGAPQLVTTAATSGDAALFYGFSLAPDGDGFLIIEQGEGPTPIKLTTNWFDKLAANLR